MGLLPHATFALAAAVSALVATGIVMWLGSISEIKEFTAMQYGMAVGYVTIFAIWIGAEAGFWQEADEDDSDAAPGELTR